MLVYKVVVTIKHPQYKTTSFLGLHYTPHLDEAKAKSVIKHHLLTNCMTICRKDLAEFKFTFNKADYQFTTIDQPVEDKS